MIRISLAREKVDTAEREHRRTADRSTSLGEARRSRIELMSTRRTALRPTVVVEDDRVLRGAICGALEDAGFHPVECADLGTARSAIARLQPAVVVLDLTLGSEFGGELLEELSLQDDAPAVVICSAFGLATLLAAQYSVVCVQKPFELESLLEAVERAVEEKRSPNRRRTG
jgi:DNA-binding NtrC family response regulator